MLILSLWLLLKTDLKSSSERTVTHLEKEELHIWRKRSMQEKLPSVTQGREHGPGPDSFQGMKCLVFGGHL